MARTGSFGVLVALVLSQPACWLRFKTIFGVKGSVVPHGNIPSILLQIEQHVHNLSLMWVTQWRTGHCISLSRFSHPPVHRFQSLSAAPVCVIQLQYTKARRSFAFTPPAGEK